MKKMDYGKYIIVLEMGHKVAILFSILIPHDTFLRCYSKANIVSGGFFRIEKQDIITFGESTSLDLSPNNEEDETIIEKVLKLKT